MTTLCANEKRKKAKRKTKASSQTQAWMTKKKRQMLVFKIGIASGLNAFSKKLSKSL